MKYKYDIIVGAMRAFDSFVIAYQPPKEMVDGLRCYLTLRILVGYDNKTELLGANSGLRTILDVLDVYRATRNT